METIKDHVAARVSEWACDLLVRIATEHLMTRKGHRCGICRTRWPCHTYRLATGDPES